MLEDEDIDFWAFTFSDSKEKKEIYLAGRSRLSQTMLYFLRILTQLCTIVIFCVFVLAISFIPLILAIKVSTWFLLAYLFYLLIYSYIVTNN